MKRKLLLLGILLLGALFSASTGLLVPRDALAFNQDTGGGGGGGGGGLCSKQNCTTTYTGPTGVECCCWYQCPSGGTWVCRSGYCAS
jgi:hypothetical protein